MFLTICTTSFLYCSTVKIKTAIALVKSVYIQPLKGMMKTIPQHPRLKILAWLPTNYPGLIMLWKLKHIAVSEYRSLVA